MTVREGSSGSWTHSVAFRQALVYALIFGLSVIVLFGLFPGLLFDMIDTATRTLMAG